MLWIGFTDPKSSYFLDANCKIAEQQLRDHISNRVWSNMNLYTQEQVDRMVSLVPTTGEVMDMHVCVTVMKIDAQD